MAQDGNARPTFKFFNSHNTSGAQTVKSTVGTLRSIAVNTPAAGTITLLDGATALGVITVTAGQAFFMVYDLAFNNSLSINPSVATMDITVSYI